ncbi:MAG: hypothetical protein WA840_04160 [Caulobacteraceae bacterium]
MIRHLLVGILLLTAMRFDAPAAAQTTSITGDCAGTGTSSIPVVCTKTNGVGFAPSATTDTTNAGNITSGTLGSGRIAGAYSGITGIGTLTSGAIPLSLVSGAGTAASASTGTSGTTIPFLNGANTWTGQQNHLIGAAIHVLPTGSDWLPSLSGYGGGNANAVLFESFPGLISGTGGPAATFAGRTAGGTLFTGAYPGIIAWGYNDNNVTAIGQWAIYDECRRGIGDNVGPCVGNELDVTEFNSITPSPDPYANAYGGGKEAVGFYAQSGGSCGVGGYTCVDPVSGTVSSPQPAFAAFSVGNNAATFKTAFKVNYNAILGNDGMTDGESASAFQLPRDDRIDWFFCSNTMSYPANCGTNLGASIVSTVKSSASAQRLLFADGLGSIFENNAGGFMLDVGNCPSCVNGIETVGGAAGAPVSVVAIGSDANVNLELAGKGVGTISINSNATMLGYIKGNSPAPTLSSCGRATITGSHIAGTVIGSSTTAGICTINWIDGFWPTTPHCVVTPWGANNPMFINVQNPAGMIVSASASMSSASQGFNYVCVE